MRWKEIGMNTEFIKGVVVPMITPIDKDELIDEAAIRGQVDYVIKQAFLFCSRCS